LPELILNTMAVKLGNGSDSHEENGATTQVEQDVAAGGADAVNGDKSQVQGKGKGGKGKNKPKPKAKSDAQSKERIQRLDQLYSYRTLSSRYGGSYATKVSRLVPKSTFDQLY
jgi:hypothetical protein